MTQRIITMQFRLKLANFFSRDWPNRVNDNNLVSLIAVT